ncbi:MAG: tetratricopeptide repeat protein [Thermodesulfobacteriota bacterium]|nr:tetratricopeptide repeat protein [Thermodesulfobacteriota bacterium]
MVKHIDLNGRCNGLRMKGIGCVLIIVGVVAVYWQTTGFSLVLADDINTIIYLKAFTGSFSANIINILTSPPAHVPYWMPVTMSTYLLDYTIFGINPQWHHLTSLLLHGITGVLLFLVLQIMTRAPFRSFLVALLWAVHPLNVASVAWLAGRSSIISTLFLVVAIGFYAGYVNTRRLMFYCLALLCFLLGLLSKPSVIYFPLFLVILDYWPLGRYGHAAGNRLHCRRLIVEKLPFFLISALWVTGTFYFFHSTSFAAPSIDHGLNPVVYFNGFVSLAAYIWKFFLPTGLPLYTPPVSEAHLRSLWLIAGAAVAMGLLAALVIGKRKPYPYLLTGGFIFLVSLLPHLGICIGQQQLIIERYAYVPVIGLCLIVVWGVGGLLARYRLKAAGGYIVISAMLVLYAAMAWTQTKHWKDSEHYFRHAVAINPGSARTYANFGEVLFNAGKTGPAIEAFHKAIDINPKDAVAHHDLGLALSRAGDPAQALMHYQTALAIDPDYPEAHSNLANLLADMGGIDEAIRHYQAALSIDPSLYQVHNNLAIVLVQKGDMDTAVAHLRKALSINPGYEKARENLQHLLNGRH